jgi:hypothetical protein
MTIDDLTIGQFARLVEAALDDPGVALTAAVLAELPDLAALPPAQRAISIATITQPVRTLAQHQGIDIGANGLGITLDQALTRRYTQGLAR